MQSPCPRPGLPFHSRRLQRRELELVANTRKCAFVAVRLSAREKLICDFNVKRCLRPCAVCPHARRRTFQTTLCRLPLGVIMSFPRPLLHFDPGRKNMAERGTLLKIHLEEERKGAGEDLGDGVVGWRELPTRNLGTRNSDVRVPFRDEMRCQNVFFIRPESPFPPHYSFLLLTPQSCLSKNEPTSR
jgi:hypothetical protein